MFGEQQQMLGVLPQGLPPLLSMPISQGLPSLLYQHFPSYNLQVWVCRGQLELPSN